MSTEITQDTSLSESNEQHDSIPKGNSSGNQTPPAPQASSLGGARNDSARGDVSVASDETTAGESTETSPSSSVETWLLFNVLVPIALLLVAGGIVKMLGTVQSPARPPIDDTRSGRLFALPAVDVVPVRSLRSTGQKLQLKTDGTVVPFREIVLATEVAGRIIEKSPKCEAGKFVRKGEMLMAIDPTDYQLEVKRLRRLQQQEYESLGEIDQEMANTQKSIELAKADIQLQQRELKRQQDLPDQFASQGEVDRARRALLQAEQSLLVLQNQIDLAKKRRVRLESAEQMAKMQLEAAENNLTRTTITAPMDGVIVSEQAELNTFVARGSPVVTMEDTSKVEVAASLRTDQLYWVLNQDRKNDVVLNGPNGNQVRGYKLPPTPVMVQYQLSGRDDLTYQWSGELVGYDGIGLDEQTRTVPVRIVVDEPQQFIVKRNGRVIGGHGDSKIAGPTTLVRGMFVQLSLQLNPAMELVVLPSEALKPGNRVWQFTPDDSVLEVSIDPTTETESESAADNDAPKELDGGADDEDPAEEKPIDDDSSDAETGDELAETMEAFAAKGFDPAQWVPGQLRIIQDVRPIDRFVDDDATPPDDRDAQYWICEVSALDSGGDSDPGDPGASTGNLSYVVVSPLGSLQSDVIPVRASSDVIEPAPASTSGDRTLATTKEAQE